MVVEGTVAGQSHWNKTIYSRFSGSESKVEANADRKKLMPRYDIDTTRNEISGVSIGMPPSAKFARPSPSEDSHWPRVSQGSATGS